MLATNKITASTESMIIKKTSIITLVYFFTLANFELDNKHIKFNILF